MDNPNPKYLRNVALIGLSLLIIGVGTCVQSDAAERDALERRTNQLEQDLATARNRIAALNTSDHLTREDLRASRAALALCRLGVDAHSIQGSPR